MDCKQIRDLVSELWGGELPGEAREHLSKCAACEAFWRDARLVQAGFHALAEEAVPEPSLGFASRLLRRVQEWEEQGARSEFFETVGRRFVYATLALTLALLLSLALPTSGPVRGVAGADFLGLQSSSQASQPDVVGGDLGDSHDLNPGRLPD
jgi:predicted anti-sigma-YlaC factor YlaD